MIFICIYINNEEFENRIAIGQLDLPFWESLQLVSGAQTDSDTWTMDLALPECVMFSCVNALKVTNRRLSDIPHRISLLSLAKKLRNPREIDRRVLSIVSFYTIKTHCDCIEHCIVNIWEEFDCKSQGQSFGKCILFHCSSLSIFFLS